MSTTEITTKIQALKEWEALAAEAAAEIESLKDEIKKEMESRGVEEMEAGAWRKWKPVSTLQDLQLSCPTASILPHSSGNTAQCISSTPSRPLPGVSPLAHKESPLPNSRPKQQARDFHPRPQQRGSGYTHYSYPLP